MNYTQTIEVLQKFYTDCVKFWKRENAQFPKLKAKNDIRNITTNPFEPNGEKLNEDAKADFLKMLEL